MESYTVLSLSAVVCESPLLTLLDCPDTESTRPFFWVLSNCLPDGGGSGDVFLGLVMIEMIFFSFSMFLSWEPILSFWKIICLIYFLLIKRVKVLVKNKMNDNDSY